MRIATYFVLVALLAVGGCSDSTDTFISGGGPSASPGGTASLLIVHPEAIAARQPGLPSPPPIAANFPPTGRPSPGPTPRVAPSVLSTPGGPIPAGVDTLEVKGFDASGRSVYGWPSGPAVRVPASSRVSLDNVPRAVTRIHLDYLRNAGYALRVYDQSVDLTSGGQVVITNPAHAASTPATSTFAITKTGPQYRLTLNSSPFIAKGIDYSPIAIGDSTGYPPDLGDKFWTTPSAAEYGDWSALWARDLPNLRELGCNTIRTYQYYPYPVVVQPSPNPASLPSPNMQVPSVARNYQPFLDQCWNNGEQPVYVVIGLALSAQQIDINGQDPTWITWANNTVTQLTGAYGTHPALMGLCVSNEQNQPMRCYDANEPTHFFWNQIQSYAALFKSGAPGKITTIAFQDDQNLFANSPVGMALCTSIDAWGINPYTGLNFAPIWSMYASTCINVTSIAKPLFLTEWGCPSTGHLDSTQASIYENVTTQTNAANQIQSCLTDMYTANGSSNDTQHTQYCLGGWLFEYADEWWNQVDLTLVPPAAHVPWQWFGGTASGGFANGYWDQDGFGLFNLTIQPTRGLPPSGPVPSPGIQAQFPYAYWAFPPSVNSSPVPNASPYTFLPDIAGKRVAATTVQNFFTGLTPSPSP